MPSLNLIHALTGPSSRGNDHCHQVSNSAFSETFPSRVFSWIFANPWGDEEVSVPQAIIPDRVGSGDEAEAEADRSRAATPQPEQPHTPARLGKRARESDTSVDYAAQNAAVVRLTRELQELKDEVKVLREEIEELRLGGVKRRRVERDDMPPQLPTPNASPVVVRPKFNKAITVGPGSGEAKPTAQSLLVSMASIPPPDWSLTKMRKRRVSKPSATILNAGQGIGFL